MNTEHFHITIDGVPKCISPLWLDGLTFWRSVYCGHESRESAEQSVDILRKALPQAKIEIVPGKCPERL